MTIAKAILIAGSAGLAAVATAQARSKSEWKVLFDGKSLDAWRGYKNDAVPKGWVIENGTLAKHDRVADIVSKEEFGNFELTIDWKIGEAGNSGIFYRVTEEYDHIYCSAPEYQLLDDAQATDNKTRLTCAGSAYALYPSPAGHLKPVGEWNTMRIVANGNHVEHWLNGVKLLEYELGSPTTGKRRSRRASSGTGRTTAREARPHRDAGRPRGGTGVSEH